MFPPATIDADIAIEGHVDFNLFHVNAWVELQMPQHDVAGIGVGRAEMIHGDK